MWTRRRPEPPTIEVPARIELPNATHLRQFEERDARAVADAVRVSLEHLGPWMAWADAASCDPGFQRRRIRGLPMLAARSEEWQYGIFTDADENLLGSVGLHARRGPGVLEIGYWLHVDAVGNGYVTVAAGALTELGLGLPGIDEMLIYCDVTNAASAAVPRRLGYTHERTERRAPTAPGETGQMMRWAKRTA